MKRLLTTVFAAIICTYAAGQSEFTMNMMEHVYQSTYVNPTARPDHKVSIGLPGISSLYTAFAFTPFKYSETYDPNSVNSATGAPQYDLEKTMGLLKNGGLIHLGASTDVFHIRFKARNTFLSFGMRTVMDYYYGIPTGMGEILNNVDKISATEYKFKTWDFSELSTDFTHYNEYSFGISTFQKKFIYSVRLKYLQGLSNVMTENTGAKAIFNEFGELSVPPASIVAYASGPIDTSLTVNKTFEDNPQNYFTNFKNMGFGADIGLGYMVTPKLTLSLAVNNLGFINWRSNIQTLESSGNTKFEGLDVFNNILQGKQLSDIEFGDNFKLKKGVKESYTSYLLPSFYFTAKYNLTPRLTVSATVQMQKYHRVRLGLSGGAQLKMSRVFSLTGNVNYQYNAVNFGAGLVFKPGPVQLYLAIDHLSAIRNYYDGKDSYRFSVPDIKQFNFRFGINLVFGREQVPNAQTLNY